jgi:hypothetical protein
MEKFFVVRDSHNSQYAADTLEEAIQAAFPDKVSDIVMVGVVYAEDVGIARLETVLYSDNEITVETVGDALANFFDDADQDVIEVDPSVVDNVWDIDEIEVSKLGIKVPGWIDQDITVSQARSITEGGCSSGAYMPAVTYYQATETMAAHGDDVLEYIENNYGDETPAAPKGTSWAGMACFYFSLAVELWASGVMSDLDQ